MIELKTNQLYLIEERTIFDLYKFDGTNNNIKRYTLINPIVYILELGKRDERIDGTRNVKLITKHGIAYLSFHTIFLENFREIKNETK